MSNRLALKVAVEPEVPIFQVFQRLRVLEAVSLECPVITFLKVNNNFSDLLPPKALKLLRVDKRLLK
jgi:hypothetical protein